MADPTLKDLAQAQIDNPDNSWTKGLSPQAIYEANAAQNKGLAGPGTEDVGLRRPELANLYGDFPQGLAGNFTNDVAAGYQPNSNGPTNVMAKGAVNANIPFNQLPMGPPVPPTQPPLAPMGPPVPPTATELQALNHTPHLQPSKSKDITPTPAQLAAAQTLHELPVNLSQMSDDTQKHMVDLAKGTARSEAPHVDNPSVEEYQKQQPMGPPVPPVTPQSIGAKPVGGLSESPLAQYGKDWQAQEDARVAATQKTAAADQAISDARSAGLATAANIGKQGALGDAIQGSLMQDAQKSAMENMNQRTQEIEKERASLNDAKIDPKHYYKQQGTLGTILGAIAIGLGAFGAAMPHTTNHTNYAADIINGAIEKDIAAQKDDLDNKWKALTAKSNMAKDEFTRSQWNIEQMSRERERGWLNVKQQIQSQMSQTDSDQAKQEGGKLLGVADDRIAQIREEALDHRMKVAGLQANQAAAGAARQQAQRDFVTARTAYYTQEGGLSPKEAGQRALEEANIKYKGVLPSGEEPYASRKIKEDLIKQDAKGQSTNQGLDKGIQQVQDQYDEMMQNNLHGNPGMVRSAVGPAAKLLNPGGDTNLAIQRRDQINKAITTSMHQVMTIRGQEFVESQATPYLITPYDNDATIAQKKASYEKFMRPQANLGSGKKSVTDEKE